MNNAPSNRLVVGSLSWAELTAIILGFALREFGEMETKRAVIDEVLTPGRRVTVFVIEVLPRLPINDDIFRFFEKIGYLPIVVVVPPELNQLAERFGNIVDSERRVDDAIDGIEERGLLLAA